MKWWNLPWNPVLKCTPVDETCLHCWAKDVYERFHVGQSFAGVELEPHVMDKPLRKLEKTTYFVANMSDLFHRDVPDDYIHEVFAVMTLAPWHNFFVLTKRVERALSLFTAPDCYDRRLKAADRVRNRTKIGGNVGVSDPRLSPPHNIAFGVTVGLQAHADVRIPQMLRVPAYKHFVSYEPALGPVEFRREWMEDVKSVPRIDWIVAGGENHFDARVCYIEWLWSTILQCRRWFVPVMIKQIGTHPRCQQYWKWPDDHVHLSLDDSGGGYIVKGLKSRAGKDPSEWPEDLRVHQTLEFGYPNVEARDVSRSGHQGCPLELP